MEINIPPKQIYANSKGGLIIEGGVMLSEYSMSVMGLRLKYKSFMLVQAPTAICILNATKTTTS